MTYDADGEAPVLQAWRIVPSIDGLMIVGTDRSRSTSRVTGITTIESTNNGIFALGKGGHVVVRLAPDAAME